MKTKRFVGRIVMIAALAVMTAGVMPAPGGGGCGTCGLQIHTYAEQSSIGNPFEMVWIWLGSFARPIL